MDNNKAVQTAKNPIITACIAVVVALIMVISYIVALGKFENSDTGEQSKAQSAVSSEAQPESVPVSEDVTSETHPVYSYYDQLKLGNRAFTNDKVYKGNLAVVTSKNNAPDIDEDALKQIAYTRESSVYPLKDWTLVAYEEAILNIEKLIVDFYKDVPDNDLAVWNGYLPVDEVSEDSAQIDLVTGYSLQFALYAEGGSSHSFSDTEYSFLKDKAPLYGVIRRYAEGKEGYTNHEASSSVYRYVGLAHSGYMNHYNYCLEEYIAKIKSEGVLEFESTLATDKGSKYVVYYVPMDKSSNTTYVPVPTGGVYEYDVSGDGSEGFIVTVKFA